MFSRQSEMRKLPRKILRTAGYFVYLVCESRRQIKRWVRWKLLARTYNDNCRYYVVELPRRISKSSKQGSS